MADEAVPTSLIRSSSSQLKLVIDGCNGPIRFREYALKRRLSKDSRMGSPEVDHETGRDVEGNGSSGDDNCCKREEEEDEMILSLLRPETIVSVTKPNSHGIKGGRGTKTRKKKAVRGKRNTKNRSPYDAKGPNDEIPHHRLDMVPLLKQILMPPPLIPKGEGKVITHPQQIFDSISVIFDGVSITKRPPLPTASSKQHAGRPRNQEEVPEEEIADRGRCWHVTTKSGTSIQEVVVAPAEIGTNGEPSGQFTIEVTGLYDETDNVIVERLIRQQQEAQPPQERVPHPADTHAAAFVARLQTLRRTERGPGKNRRLLQPLGLLRPESVACLFELGCHRPIGNESIAIQPEVRVGTPSDNGDSCHAQDGDFGQHSSEPFSTSCFPRLARDGRQTQRSIRKNNPGSVFVDVEDPMELVCVGSASKSNNETTIVVTDDIFLRQRIVHHGGYVMTFHQLWLLLWDVLDATM